MSLLSDLAEVPSSLSKASKFTIACGFLYLASGLLLLAWPGSVQALFLDPPFAGRDEALVRLIGMLLAIVGWFYVFGGRTGRTAVRRGHRARPSRSRTGGPGASGPLRSLPPPPVHLPRSSIRSSAWSLGTSWRPLRRAPEQSRPDGNITVLRHHPYGGEPGRVHRAKGRQGRLGSRRRMRYEGGEDLSPEFVAEFLSGIDCYVMGSRTYETALGFESRGSGWPYGDTPTFVLTHRDLPRTRDTVEFYAGDLSHLCERAAQASLPEHLVRRRRNRVRRVPPARAG